MNRRYGAYLMKSVLDEQTSSGEKLLKLRTIEFGMDFADKVCYMPHVYGDCCDFIRALPVANAASVIVKNYMMSCVYLAKKNVNFFLKTFAENLVEREAVKIIEGELIKELNRFVKMLYEGFLTNGLFRKSVTSCMMLLVYSLYEHIKEKTEVWGFAKFNEDGCLCPSAEIGFVGRSLAYYELFIASACGCDHDDMMLKEQRFVDELYDCGYGSKTVRDLLGYAYGRKYYYSNVDLSSRSMQSVLPLIYYGGKDFLNDCMDGFQESSRKGEFDFSFIRNVLEGNDIKELLHSRNYRLPSKGVTANFLAAGDVRTLYMEEVFVDDKVILLWRIECEEFTTYGYYDTKEDCFFSEFKMSREFKYKSHQALKAFVLENYALMVCEEVNVAHGQEMVVLGQDEELEDYLILLEGEKVPPIVKYAYTLVKEDWDHSSNTREINHRRFPIRIGKDSVAFKEVEIGITIRKLHAGWVASDKAKELARKYGYDLLPGYTFVGAFKKKLSVNK